MTMQSNRVFTRLFTSNTPWYFLDFALESSEMCIAFYDHLLYFMTIGLLIVLNCPLYFMPIESNGL